MNLIEGMKTDLAQTFPDVWMDLSEPLLSDGVWFLEVKLGPTHLSVEWRLGKGFGITSLPSNDPGYGEHPDEYWEDATEAFGRVVYLIHFEKRTQPPVVPAPTAGSSTNP
jgi:hypothetical protein